MSPARLALFTAFAMVAFAANSLLCRLALIATDIDPASFTTIRLVAGAFVLVLLVSFRNQKTALGGNWLSAAALLVYAAGFSFAYISLSAATGALLLFGAVQATMIGYGLATGERPNGWQLLGMGVALAGLVVLFLPGLEAPPLVGAFLMIGSGIAWGVYSLRGRGLGDATQATAGNFLRAVPLALVISLAMWPWLKIDTAGAVYAILSGALASGVGYAIWYTVLPSLRATTAATVQLSVPALAAFGGVLFLAEPVSFRLALAALATLGGVAVYILSKDKSAAAR